MQPTITRTGITRHTYITVDGRRVHYQHVLPEEKAGATPLVLLHGLGGNINWWDENLPMFGRYYPVYALDLPGFGYSQSLANKGGIQEQAQHVIHWLDAMGLSHVHLLGHSMGGQVAMEAAIIAPQRIARLVLAAPAGMWPPFGRWLRWNMHERPRVKVPLAFSLRIATGTMRTSPRTIVRSFRAIAGYSSEARLQQLRVPTLVVWGTADAVLPPELGPRVVAAIPSNARLTYVTDGTHNFMTDQAERFNNIIHEFLTEKIEPGTEDSTR